MKRLFSTTHIFGILPVSLMCLMSLVIFSLWAAKPAVKPKFDRDLYKSFLENQFDDLDEACFDFRTRQDFFIDIAPPGIQVFLQYEGVRCFNTKGWPVELVEGLRSVLKNGITLWPLTVFEDPASEPREFVFVNADGKEIYSVPAYGGDDRDQHWLVLLRYPNLYDGTRTQEEIDKLIWNFEPSRIAVQWNLILKDDLYDYVLQLSQTLEPIDPPIIMKAYSGPAVTSIKLSIEQLTNGTEITVIYPAGFTNDLDIFRTESLMNDPWWDLVCTTNVSATNWIEWLDTSVAGGTNGKMYYRAANADFFADGVDSDGDGIPFGREKFWLHSDPDNADTDFDLMPDGFELEHGFDLLDPSDASQDADNDGLSNLEEYLMDTDPHNQSDGLALLETSRAKILSHWYMVMTNNLSFTNTPGSATDLNDLKTALNSLSGKFYRIEAQ